MPPTPCQLIASPYLVGWEILREQGMDVAGVQVSVIHSPFFYSFSTFSQQVPGRSFTMGFGGPTLNWAFCQSKVCESFIGEIETPRRSTVRCCSCAWSPARSVKLEFDLLICVQVSVSPRLTWQPPDRSPGRAVFSFLDRLTHRHSS